MKRSTALLFALAVTAGSASASLLTWQTEVNTGATPSATVFTPTLGSSPAVVNVGNLSGDRSFEFIYNAAAGGASQALIGTQAGVSGAQGLKANQWNNTGMYGMTDFGVADYTSTIPALVNQDVHAVYTSDGVDTKLYLNGSLAYTFAGVDLTITGLNALAAASNGTQTAFFDNLLGTVLGFASYDTALSPAEISVHYNSFAGIPEPGTGALALAAAGLALSARRRRTA